MTGALRPLGQCETRLFNVSDTGMYDFIPYWTQNIVCTAVKFLSMAAKRAVTHQREHHHGYTAPTHG